MKLGVIGFGNMGGAIVKSCLKMDVFAPSEISAIEPSPEKQSELRSLGITVMERIKSLIVSSDIILLAVKPQSMPKVLDEISGLAKGKMIISIAAGISIDFIRSRIGEDSYILRAMPNSPILVGCGATVLACSAGSVPKELWEKSISIFSSAGETVILDESEIDPATALNGSSPAYFYRIVGIMEEFAAKHGIDKSLARRLAAKSMEGAAIMLLNSEKDTDELISAVASPGGTTLAALDTMDALGFDEVFSSALMSCKNRASELGK